MISLKQVRIKAENDNWTPELIVTEDVPIMIEAVRLYKDKTTLRNINEMRMERRMVFMSELREEL